MYLLVGLNRLSSILQNTGNGYLGGGVDKAHKCAILSLEDVRPSPFPTFGSSFELEIDGQKGDGVGVWR